MNRIGPLRQRRQNSFVVHAHRDGWVAPIELILSSRHSHNCKNELGCRFSIAPPLANFGYEHVAGVRGDTLPQHVRHQAISGKLRAGYVAQFSVGHAGRRIHIQLDILLLNCPLTSFSTNSRRNPRYGEFSSGISSVSVKYRAGRIVYQCPRQRVFDLCVRGCRNDGRDPSTRMIPA